MRLSKHFWSLNKPHALTQAQIYLKKVNPLGLYLQNSQFAKE